MTKSRRSGSRLRQERAGVQAFRGLGPRCEGKARFASKEEAARSIRDDPELQPFHCPIHECWHLGHPAHRRG